MSFQNVAYLSLQGPDAVRYLNGQVTNNVERDLSNLVLPACLCTLKGKVEALIWITAGEQPDSLIIQCQQAQLDSVHGRLDRYLIADDCELAICESPISFDGKICQQYGNPDNQPDSLEQADYFTLIHGVPKFGHEITGDEFPAEIGLDRWAVDFHKGCYLGQEIVSRIESVGKTKRQLQLIATDDPLKSGQEFTNEKGKTLGRVTRDSVGNPDQPGSFLSLLLAKPDWLPPGAALVDLQFPERL